MVQILFQSVEILSSELKSFCRILHSAHCQILSELDQLYMQLPENEDKRGIISDNKQVGYNEFRRKLFFHLAEKHISHPSCNRDSDSFFKVLHHKRYFSIEDESLIRNPQDFVGQGNAFGPNPGDSG